MFRFITVTSDGTSWKSMMQFDNSRQISVLLWISMQCFGHVRKAWGNKVAYWQSCRESNKIITASSASYVCDEVSKVADNPRLLWIIVRRLIHSASDGSWFDDQDMAALTSGLCHFFVDKIKLVKSKVDEGLLSFKVASHRMPIPLALHWFFPFCCQSHWIRWRSSNLHH